MNRSNTISMQKHHILTSCRQKVAYHEAGHVTAIYFNNRLKNLPPVFFQIIFKDIGEGSVNSRLTNGIGQHDCIAKVNGGRLIHSLPFAFDALDHKSSGCTDKKVFQFTGDYRAAFEADIVNLLIGPLAEAKYTAQSDDEPFKQELMTVQALKNYGGEADLAVVNDYLQSYSADKQLQNESLNQFFIQAYNFVNDKANWKVITRLANYILDSNNNIISDDEVAVVLDGQ